MLKIGNDLPGPKSIEGAKFVGGLEINQGGAPGSDTERLLAIRKLSEAVCDLARALGPSPVNVSYCTFTYGDTDKKPDEPKKKRK